MKRIVQSILLISVLLASLLPLHPARADISPPSFPPGVAILSGGSTKVQMVAEEVAITIPPSDFEMDNYLVDLTATFHMINQGKTSETMRVGFPLGCLYIPENSTVSLDGKSVEISQDEDDDSVLPDSMQRQYLECEPYSHYEWIHFDATFAPGTEVVITVHQITKPIPIGAMSYYGYILQTGAGWYGPIGKGLITVNLPYTPDKYNYWGGWDSQNKLTKTIKGHTVTYQFSNLEPTTANNLNFSIGIPFYWQPVDQAREQIKADPTDLYARLALGDALAQAAADFHGSVNPTITRLAINAYYEVFKIDPFNADAHAGIAQVIWAENYMLVWNRDFHSPKFARMYNHLSRALALDPQNERALRLVNEIEESTGAEITLPEVDPHWLAIANGTAGNQ